MKRLTTLLAGTALIMATSSAMATEVNLGGTEQNLQGVLDSITKGGHSSVNVSTDFLKGSADALWTTGGTGISSATMIIELAGLRAKNNFGIYDSTDTKNRAELFAGADTTGHKVAFTFGSFDDKKTKGNLLVQDLTDLGSYAIYDFNSSTFGFYINNGTDTFYSDTAKNSDNFDHMVAYAKPSHNDYVKLPGNPDYTPWLSNEYVLAFEDLLNGGDHDYQDMVLMVESVAPVPEPGTMLMLGAGFLGLAIYGKRRRNA